MSQTTRGGAHRTQWFREPIRRIGLSRLCNPMTCAMSPGVRATMNAAAFRDGAGAVEPLSLRARRRRWLRPWKIRLSQDEAGSPNVKISPWPD